MSASRDASTNNNKIRKRSLFTLMLASIIIAVGSLIFLINHQLSYIQTSRKARRKELLTAVTDTSIVFLTMTIVRKRVTKTSRICLAAVLLVACTFSRFEYGDASWVDPDTPDAGLTTEPLTTGDDREYTLVSAAVLLGCWNLM
jgi:energy-converting hydrogenase Eha subunit A